MTGRERFLAAARRRPVDRTPVWFMRQAGRALASYRRLREKHDLLTMARTPDLAAEVTLLPVQELGVDAAVLYADIMLPLYTMGVPFRIDAGTGPVVEAPVRTAADVEALRVADHREHIPEVFEAVALVRRELGDRGAVLGFAGAPFTLASYLIEGGPSRDYARAKGLMRSDPKLWNRLMERLSCLTITYLEAQADAGADAVQLFDSWAGALSRDDYETFVLPHSTRIITALRKRVPVIHFATNTAHLLESLAASGSDVVSVDWRLPLDEAWDRLGDRAIQGNLDPVVATIEDWGVVEAGARRVLAAAGGRAGHIFNLGHGVLPQTPEANLKRLVELVHEASAAS